MNFVYSQQRGYIKIKKTVYEYDIILFIQVYEKVIFFKDQVYDLGRFQKTGSHTRTKITAKLPPLAYHFENIAYHRMTKLINLLAEGRLVLSVELKVMLRISNQGQHLLSKLLGFHVLYI